MITSINNLYADIRAALVFSGALVVGHACTYSETKRIANLYNQATPCKAAKFIVPKKVHFTLKLHCKV